jgi:hypothetical protein
MNSNYGQTIFLLSIKVHKLPERFTIITAYNPMDALLPKEENLERNKNLFRTLSSVAKDIIPIIGSSPDYFHQEPSYLVNIALTEALKIGRSYGQRAVFWIKRDNLQIVECESAEKFIIGKFSERIIYQ